MTNEEAIKRLEDLDNCYNQLSDNDKDALDMAIAALKAEPCEDAVSREAVMQTLYDCGCESEIQDAIAELPPVTPKPLDSVIDEMSAEIEEIETYDGLYIDRAYVLQIIDKYKEGENK